MTAPHSMTPTEQTQRLPAAAEPYAEEIHAIEAELDLLWPDYERLPHVVNGVHYQGYRLRGRPFTSNGHPLEPYSMEHVRRLKWLLKRHMLLMRGLDYGVVVADGSGAQSGRCFAHPTSQRRPHPNPPPGVGPVSFPEHPGAAPARPAAADLALELSKPYGLVKRLLDQCPEGVDPRAFILQRIDRE
jgi:hypothetical protein